MINCPKCNSHNIEIKTGYEYFDTYECRVCGYWTYEKIEDCCRNPNLIVTIYRKDHDLAFLYRQCIYCGGSQNRTKPLNIKKFDNEICGEFDIGSFERWHEKKGKEHKSLAESKRNFDFFNSPKYKYYLYLSSPEWKAKRELVYKRDEYKCQKCLEKDADNVHHLTYENLGNEKLIDLISVCHDCHRAIHGL